MVITFQSAIKTKPGVRAEDLFKKSLNSNYILADKEQMSRCLQLFQFLNFFSFVFTLCT